jgi:hypothetical protein
MVFLSIESKYWQQADNSAKAAMEAGSFLTSASAKENGPTTGGTETEKSYRLRKVQRDCVTRLIFFEGL